MKKLLLLPLFLILAHLGFAQAPQDTTPTRPKQEVKVLQPIPIQVIYKTITKTGKLLDINKVTLGTMAFYQKDPQKQTQLLLQEINYQLYTNHLSPKGKNKVILLDIKRL